MTRQEILNTLSTCLISDYPPDEVERVLSCIDGIVTELDALPPYPEESEFQSQLSDQVYPFLAAAQALDMEGEDCGVLKELIEEMFPQPVVQQL